jgi:hypothetical protein
MVLKRKTQNPQAYIQAGIAFFLVGIFASTVADGRLIGAFFTNLIPSQALSHTIQVFAGGFAIPMFFASIFFMVRGLTMQRPG